MIKEVVLAFRPKTLTASLVPCLVATALAAASAQAYETKLLFFALLSAVFIQITTNLVNDAVDFEKGADNDKRIGPKRITASGVLKPTQTLRLAHLSALLAVLSALPLVMAGGWGIVILGLVSIAMAYAYTAGPFPLAYLGLGDLFVILFFGLVAVGGMFYLHTKSVTADSLWLGLQIGLHATVLIAINNFRDFATDRLVNKKTLAVRFGATFSRFEITLLLLLPFVMNFWWVPRFGLDVFILGLSILPLALYISWKICTEPPSEKYNKYLGLSALVHLAFGLLLSYALVA